jgi:alcohol dehydrogenase (cytochrome c)
MAPLVVKDRVIVGIAGGEYGIRGFVDAYDAASGTRVWRFNTVPAPGEPGSETWPKNGSWETGGAPTWMNGSFDPDLNLVYWGTGNAGPDWFGDERPGDNLYAASLLALDADTGRLRWHYQFTPHDVWDYDATHMPVLADLTINGAPRKVVMVANRNGFFYTLDRATGKVIVAKPFVETTWAKEIGKDGKPIMQPDTNPDEKGATVCPGVLGGTNFQNPAFDPRLGLFFVTAREGCMTFYGWKVSYVPGESFRAGAPVASSAKPTYGALRAIDPTTGERRWEFRYRQPTFAGVLATAGSLVFAGDGDGYFMAFDSQSGKNLWRYQTGAAVYAAANTFMVDGRQLVIIPAGGTLTALALPGASRTQGQR